MLVVYIDTLGNINARQCLFPYQPRLDSWRDYHRVISWKYAGAFTMKPEGRTAMSSSDYKIFRMRRRCSVQFFRHNLFDNTLDVFVFFFYHNNVNRVNVVQLIEHHAHIGIC